MSIGKKTILSAALLLAPLSSFAAQSCEGFSVFVFNTISSPIIANRTISNDAYVEDNSEYVIPQGRFDDREVMLKDCSDQKGKTTYHLTINDQATGNQLWKGRLEWRKKIKMFTVVTEESSKQYEIAMDVVNGGDGEDGADKNTGSFHIFIKNPKN